MPIARRVGRAAGGVWSNGNGQWQYVAVPNPVPTVSRRHVLLGTAALALFGGALSACGTPPAPDPALEVLTGQLGRARSDSALAAAAAGAAPKFSSALTAVASIRDAHAQALSDEIARRGGTIASTTISSTTTTPAAPVPAAPTAQEVVAALQQSADGAGQAAVGLDGYPAGLLASIAAACTAAYTVSLDGADA